jgi:hypothetical protein
MNKLALITAAALLTLTAVSTADARLAQNGTNSNGVTIEGTTANRIAITAVILASGETVGLR